MKLLVSLILRVVALRRFLGGDRLTYGHGGSWTLRLRGASNHVGFRVLLVHRDPEPGWPEMWMVPRVRSAGGIPVDAFWDLGKYSIEAFEMPAAGKGGPLKPRMFPALLLAFALAGCGGKKDPEPPTRPTPTPPPVEKPTPKPEEPAPPAEPEEPRECPIEEKEADFRGCYPCAKPMTCPEGMFRDHGRCCPEGALDPPPPPSDGPGGKPTPPPPPPPPDSTPTPPPHGDDDHDHDKRDCRWWWKDGHEDHETEVRDRHGRKHRWKCRKARDHEHRGWPEGHRPKHRRE